jgi:outer membrane immunogenic protein
MRHAIVAFLGATALSVASAHVATAADMPTKAPVYAPVAMYNWTGFYVGGQAGGGWYSSQTTIVAGGTNFPAGFVDNKINGDGFLGGGYAGFNYQINQFVIGIDGDYSWADLTGSGSDISPINGGPTNKNDKVKWIATMTGRVGYAVNNWLFFGKGGWAWAGFDGNSSSFSVAGANTSNSTNSETRDGWTLGTGVEWGFLPHWSAKLEYDYVKFNTSNFNITSTSVATGVATSLARSATSDLSEVKLGVAYRF